MPYRKLVALTLHEGFGWLKGLLVVAFAVNPLFVFVLAALFGLEVFLGTQTAREKGAPIRYRDYARAKYYEVVRLGAWLAVVLLVTNLDPGLIHIQRYVLIATAIMLGGRIAKRHLGGDYQGIWVELEGRVLHKTSREIETPAGQPNLVEQTITTERPPDVPADGSGPPPAALVVLVLVIQAALLLAACASPWVMSHHHLASFAP